MDLNDILDSDDSEPEVPKFDQIDLLLLRADLSNDRIIESLLAA
jgi:hypothetical protein